MVDKKMLLIIGVIVLIALAMQDGQKESLLKEDREQIVTVETPIQSPLKQNVVLASPLESCEEFRDQDISRGFDCVGECIKITSRIVGCPSMSPRLDTDDVGKYGYFYERSDSCSDVEDGDAGSKEKGQWQCMYESGEPSCTDECTFNENRCVSGTSFNKCGRDFDGDSCTEWGPATSCSEGLVCRSNECLSPLPAETGTWSPSPSTIICGQIFNQVDSATMDSRPALGTACESGTCNQETRECEDEGFDLGSWLPYIIIFFVVIIGIKLIGKGKK